MPDIPTNPDRSDLHPEDAQDAFNDSASGDFLGLGEDLGSPAFQPSDAVSEEQSPVPDSVPTATWVEGEAEEAAPADGEFAPEQGLWSEDQALEEDYLEDGELEDNALEEDALEEDEEGSASWLMEFDGDEDLPPPVLSAEDELSEGASAEEFAPASAGKTWALRLLFAGISIGIGFAGSRYLGGRATQSPPGDPIAVRHQDPGPKVTEPTPPPAATQPPAEEVVETTEPTPENLPEVAANPPGGSAVATPSQPPPAETAAERGTRTRSPFVALTGAGARPRLSPVAPFLRATRTSLLPVPVDTTSTPRITMTEGATPPDPMGPLAESSEVGRERRTHVVRVEDMLIMPDEFGGRLREASIDELSGMWMGASIPVDAIEGSARLLTPTVGRVRVLLGGGEVFEGELYAVGQKKVWLETELGKMALLSWQVDRIEHILSSDGASVLGRDGSQDLAGLERVRVRTPGGVFYGKVIDRDGATVTLITDEGARVTLREATVAPAGRSATRLVDSSRAQEDVADQVARDE